MTTPISDITFRVVLGDEQEQKDSGKPRRNRQQDDERVFPRSELRDQNQIDEDDGKNQANPKTLEGGAHALHRAAKIDANAFGKIASCLMIGRSAW